MLYIIKNATIKKKYREFFKVEKHPNQIKPWATKKRANISIQDKLIQAKNKLAELNAMSNDI